MNALTRATGGRQGRRTYAAVLALATLLTVACPFAAAEEELGRLFFTPERRQTLDRQRQLNIQEKEELPVDPTLTINGLVTRSSGKRTVWINGVPQNDNDKPGGVAVTPQGAGKVVVNTGEAPAAGAKVGETVNRNTGVATDLLGGGRIKVHPQATEKHQQINNARQGQAQ